jgi:hypothetical protein
VTDRPQRSRRQTNTRSISRRRAASRMRSRASSLRRAGVHFADLQGDRPAATGDIVTHRPVLHRQSLLVSRGNAGIETRPQHFRLLPCLAKNVTGFGFLRGPFYGHWTRTVPPGRRRSFSAWTEVIILRCCGRGQPRQGLAVVPGHPYRRALL